ncbi:hypothetical protein RhiirB3_458023 [Rhizophagus irregularis]|nr:hypothetical protein RhiirB3_458023 [Rhizophagus irregularis]
MEIVANNDLQILAFVLELLRKAVLALATLADCFLSLARLAAVLNKLPKLFNSYSHFRSVALKKVFLKKIIKCVAAIGKRLGFDLYKIDILLSQLRIEFRMGQVKSG